jgi:hypothetical protein
MEREGQAAEAYVDLLFLRLVSLDGAIHKRLMRDCYFNRRRSTLGVPAGKKLDLARQKSGGCAYFYHDSFVGSCRL